MSDPSDNPTHRGLIPMEEFCFYIDQFNIKPTTILDLGACDGRDSLVFKSYFPTADVVAVEALEENYTRWLVPLEPTIETYHAAIWLNTGERNFHVKEINGISSIRNRGSEYKGFIRTVQTYSLDDFCETFLLIPDILKLDCEGCSWDILKGGSVALRTIKAIHVETETIPYFDGQKLDCDVSDLLQMSGFKVVKAVAGADITNSQGHIGQQKETIWVRDGL